MDIWHLDHLDKLDIKCEFAPELFLEDFAFMSPKLMLMWAFINNWCADRNLDFRVTSMIRSPEYDKQLGAASTTHQEGRAFDMSLRGFSYQDVQDLIDVVAKNFSNIGAISRSSGTSRPIVVHKNHDGAGTHAHLQVRR